MSELRSRRSAAARLGISPDEYEARLAAGEKWCWGCADWHQRERFGLNSNTGDGLQSRCRDSRRRARRDADDAHNRHLLARLLAK